VRCRVSRWPKCPAVPESKSWNDLGRKMLVLVSRIPMWSDLGFRELPDEALENLLSLIQCEIYSSIHRGVLGPSLKPLGELLSILLLMAC
jgi:hypothetical protein